MPVPAFNIPNFIGLYQPPNYRLPKWLTFVQGLCGGLTWRKAIFDAYRNGDAQTEYDSATSYAADAVVWWNYATYQSLIAGNTGNPPDISPSAWMLRCASFIGASERVKYNGRYLYLTWALNRQFGTTFRQPPYPAPYGGPPLTGPPPGTFSDIYITTTVPVNVSFVMYPGDTGSSVMYPATSAPYYLFNSPVYTSATSYEMTIHFPIAAYTALGTTDLIRLSIIDNFVKKYQMCGCTYNVVTY